MVSYCGASRMCNSMMACDGCSVKCTDFLKCARTEQRFGISVPGQRVHGAHLSQSTTKAMPSLHRQQHPLSCDDGARARVALAVYSR